MPRSASTATSRPKAKPKPKAKVVNNRGKSAGLLDKLRSRSGMLFVAVAFVVVGALTIAWTQAATTTSSLWSNSDVPKVLTDTDTDAVELGVKFQAKYAGTIDGVKFYKGPQNTGTHVGNLWSADGKKLASVTFTNETKTGWQTANFAKPVDIAANTTYVVSYFAPKGRYSVTENYFSKSFANGNLTALKNGKERGNGVYRYSSTSTFPSQSYRSSNYWVDVVYSTKRFNPSPLPAAPSNLTTSVNGKDVTVKWKDSVTAGISYYEIARDETVIGKNQTGAGYLDAGLTAGKTYSYKVRAVDTAGQVSAWTGTVKASIAADPKPTEPTTPTPTEPTTPTTPTNPTTPSASTCPLPKYPSPACAGYRNGATLASVSGMVVTTPGQVIENKRVNGNIDIRAHDVVIRNSEINGAVVNDNTSTRYRFTIEDSTVGPASGCSSFGNGAIGVSDYTARRVVIRNLPDGFRIAGSNVTIEDSYVNVCSSNPNDHSDGIQAYGASGAKNVVIRHNTIDQSRVTNGAATAPIFLPGEDRQGNAGATMSVIDNLLAGGSFTLRTYGLNFPAVTGNKIVNNTWAYGPLDVTCNTIGTWSGNAVVTANVAAGEVLSTVRALNECN